LTLRTPPGAKLAPTCACNPQKPRTRISNALPAIELIDMTKTRIKRLSRLSQIQNA
jgi:hypothetical protein